MVKNINHLKNNKTIKLMKTHTIEKYLEKPVIQFRINYLLGMIDDQMNEIDNDREFSSWCLKEVGLKKRFDNGLIINSYLLWIIYMSNENVCQTYNKDFKKGFWKVSPWSDIVDIYSELMYVHFHLKSGVIQGLEECIKIGLLNEIDNENLKGLRLTERKEVV